MHDDDDHAEEAPETYTHVCVRAETKLRDFNMIANSLAWDINKYVTLCMSYMSRWARTARDEYETARDEYESR